MYGSHEMFQVENATNTKVTPLSKDAGNYKWSSHLWCLKATDFVASRIRNWHLGDFSKTKAQIASPWSTQDPKMPWESTSEKYGEILSIQLAPRELEVLKIHQTWKRKSVAGFFFMAIQHTPMQGTPMRNKGLIRVIKRTTMVNKPLLKALFLMGVPYMGVGGLAMIFCSGDLRKT